MHPGLTVIDIREMCYIIQRWKWSLFFKGFDLSHPKGDAQTKEYIPPIFLEDTDLTDPFSDSSASLLWNSCIQTTALHSNRAIRATQNFRWLTLDFEIYYKAFSRFTIPIKLCKYKKKGCGQKSKMRSKGKIPMSHFWFEDGGAMCQEMWVGSTYTERMLTDSQQGVSDLSSITTRSWILPTTKMTFGGEFFFHPRTARWQLSSAYALISALQHPEKRICRAMLDCWLQNWEGYGLSIALFSRGISYSFKLHVNPQTWATESPSHVNIRGSNERLEPALRF